MALWNYIIFILLHINSITMVTSKEEILMKHCKATILCLTMVIVVSTSFVRKHFISFIYLYKLFISLRRAILVWMPTVDSPSDDLGI